MYNQPFMNMVPRTTAPAWREGWLPSESLLPLVYDELRRMAASCLRAESAGHTLQPTALVHEAWLRLAGRGESGWENRTHFCGAAARAMRRILVDHARRKAARKRQADELPPGSGPEVAQGTPDGRILMIHAHLERLKQEEPAAAEIVLLKFFSGLGSREIARLTGRSVRSVERSWTFAKARLYQMICEEA